MEQFNIKHVKFNLRNNKSHEAAAVSLEKLIFTNAKKTKISSAVPAQLFSTSLYFPCTGSTNPVFLTSEIPAF